MQNPFEQRTTYQLGQSKHKVSGKAKSNKAAARKRKKKQAKKNK